jgi:hypothetical protein
MTSNRNTRRGSDQRTVERWIREALDDMRRAAALLKAVESQLMSRLKTQAAGAPGHHREPGRGRAAAGIPRRAAVGEKRTGKRQAE